MAHDGFSLDDKRVAIDENDIPDVIQCWTKRFDATFGAGRTKRISALRRELTPLKTERLKLHEEINRLMFESAIQNPLTTVNRPDRFSQKSCAPSLMSARELRWTRVTMKPVRSGIWEGLFESLLAESFS
jgi:hypothetical protein